MDKLLVKELMNSNNFWTLNKKLVASLGIEETFLISVMAEAEKLLSDDEGWFYQTSDTLESFTGIKKDRQIKLIKSLVSKDILEKELRGLPRKRYFKFNYEAIQRLVVVKCDDCKKENATPSGSENRRNKESIINKVNKENNSLGIIEFINSLEISDDLRDSLLAFEEYRRIDKKKPWTVRSLNITLKKLKDKSKYINEKHLILSIENSIENTWQGIIPARIDKYSDNKSTDINLTDVV